MPRETCFLLLRMTKMIRLHILVRRTEILPNDRDRIFQCDTLAIGEGEAPKINGPIDLQKTFVMLRHALAIRAITGYGQCSA